MVDMSKQGAWERWEHVEPRKLTWAKLWRQNLCAERSSYNRCTTSWQFTSLRPDVVLTSESTKQVVLLELTVPREDRIDKANECKRAKYSEPTAERRNNGWKAHCEPVEIGCRGFAGYWLQRVFKLLGTAVKVTKNILEVAEKASGGSMVRYLDTSRGLITPEHPNRT